MWEEGEVEKMRKTISTREQRREPERVVFSTAGSRANLKPAEIRREEDRRPVESRCRPPPGQTELKNVRALSTSVARSSASLGMVGRRGGEEVTALRGDYLAVFYRNAQGYQGRWW